MLQLYGLLDSLFYITYGILLNNFLSLPFYESAVPGLKEVMATQYTSSFVSFNT